MTTPKPVAGRLAVALLASMLMCRPPAAGADVAARTAPPTKAVSAICPATDDAAAMQQAARVALGNERRIRLTPLLPAPWPHPTSAIFYTFDLLPLPTGEASFSVSGPLRRVVIESLDSPPKVTPFKRKKPLGREESTYFGHQLPTPEVLTRAQQELLGLIKGCQSPEAALPKLEPYREWFSVHPLVAKDLRARHPAFMKWLFSVWSNRE
jgi:hypothetical protein